MDNRGGESKFFNFFSKSEKDGSKEENWWDNAESSASNSDDDDDELDVDGLLGGEGVEAAKKNRRFSITNTKIRVVTALSGSLDTVKARRQVRRLAHLICFLDEETPIVKFKQSLVADLLQIVTQRSHFMGIDMSLMNAGLAEQIPELDRRNSFKDMQDPDDAGFLIRQYRMALYQLGLTHILTTTDDEQRYLRGCMVAVQHFSAEAGNTEDNPFFGLLRWVSDMQTLDRLQFHLKKAITMDRLTRHLGHGFVRSHQWTPNILDLLAIMFYRTRKSGVCVDINGREGKLALNDESGEIPSSYEKTHTSMAVDKPDFSELKLSHFIPAPIFTTPPPGESLRISRVRTHGNWSQRRVDVTKTGDNGDDYSDYSSDYDSRDDSVQSGSTTSSMEQAADIAAQMVEEPKDTMRRKVLRSHKRSFHMRALFCMALAVSIVAGIVLVWIVWYQSAMDIVLEFKDETVALGQAQLEDISRVWLDPLANAVLPLGLLTENPADDIVSGLNFFGTNAWVFYTSAEQTVAIADKGNQFLYAEDKDGCLSWLELSEDLSSIIRWTTRDMINKDGTPTTSALCPFTSSNDGCSCPVRSSSLYSEAVDRGQHFTLPSWRGEDGKLYQVSSKPQCSGEQDAVDGSCVGGPDNIVGYWFAGRDIVSPTLPQNTYIVDPISRIVLAASPDEAEIVGSTIDDIADTENIGAVMAVLDVCGALDNSTAISGTWTSWTDCDRPRSDTYGVAIAHIFDPALTTAIIVIDNDAMYDFVHTGNNITTALVVAASVIGIVVGIFRLWKFRNQGSSWERLMNHYSKLMKRDNATLTGWLIFVIFVLFLGVWFVWSVSTDGKVAEVLNSHLDEKHRAIRTQVTDIMEDSAQSVVLTAQELEILISADTTVEPYIGLGTSWIDSRPSPDLEKIFANSFIRNPTNSLFYIGFEDGTFTGAGFSAFDGVEYVYSAARDSSNDMCYSKYEMLSTGVRSDNLLWQKDFCLYDPRDRPWYKAAVAANGTGVWQQVYTFSGGDLGITFAEAVLDTSGNVFAVVAVDFKLTQIQEALSVPLNGLSSDELTYLADIQGRLVATSLAEVPLVDQDNNQLQALLSTNQLVHESAEKVIQTYPEYGFAEPELSISDLGPILLDVQRINWHNSNATHQDWALVYVKARSTSAIGTADQRGDLALLFVVGTFLATLFVTTVFAKEFSRPHRQPKIVEDEQFQISTLLNHANSTQQVYKIMEYLQPLITVSDDDTSSYHPKENNGGLHRGATFFAHMNRFFSFENLHHDVRTGMFERAVYYLHAAKHRRLRIELLCKLENSGQWYSLWVYLLYMSPFFRHAQVFFNAVHILLFFFEAPSSDTYEGSVYSTDYRRTVIAIESVILLFYLVDAIVRVIVSGFFLPQGFWRRWYTSMWKLPVTLRILIYLMIFAGWCYRLADRHLFMSRLARPLLLLVSSDRTRQAVFHFLRTIASAKDIFVLFAAFLGISVAVGMSLFRNSAEYLEVNEGLIYERNFATVKNSVLSMFIFMTTGENYPDLVDPILNGSSKVYGLFFIVFSMLGMFIMIALLIGVFQQAYTNLYAEHVVEQRATERTGLIAAFVCLNSLAPSRKGKISRAMFRKFIYVWKPHLIEQKHAIEQLFEIIDPMNDLIDVEEFISVCETLERHAIEYPFSSTPGLRLRLRTVVFESSLYRSFQSLLAMTQIFLICLSATVATVSDREVVDWIMLGFVIFYILEFIFKLFAFGPSGYFKHPAMDRRISHRIDLFLVLISAGSLVASFANQGTIGEDDLLLRMMYAVPTLRIFYIPKRVRRIVFTFALVLPSYGSILSLVLGVFLVFAVCGMQLFGGVLTHFQNMETTVFTLYQLFTGEAWHEVMYKYMEELRTFSAAYFFSSFIIIEHLLFANLVIGILVDSFSKIFANKSLMNEVVENRGSITEKVFDENHDPEWLEGWVRVLSENYSFVEKRKAFIAMDRGQGLHPSEVRHILQDFGDRHMRKPEVDSLFDAFDVKERMLNKSSSLIPFELFVRMLDFVASGSDMEVTDHANSGLRKHTTFTGS